MGDHPRRHQNRSCDQCRQGKRRCDVTFTPQPEHNSVVLIDAYAVSAAHSPCSNCVKWKKKCTIDWVRSREKRRTQERLRKRRTANAATRATSTASTTETPAKVGGLDDSAVFFTPVPGCLSPSNVWSDLDLSAFDTGMIVGSMGDDFVSQPPLGTANQDDFFFVEWSTGRMIQIFSDHDFSCFSSLLEETAADNDESPKIASVACHGETHLHAAPQERCTFYTQGVLDIGQIEPVSPMSSHHLAKEQLRIDIRNGLLRLYFDFLEDKLGCWYVEKNCPFDVEPLLDIRPEHDRSARLVTRVCNLDKALSTACLLSKNDQKQASRSLALAMMTLAMQWAHLVNAEDGNSFQSGQESGLGSFERRLQSSLWYQANQALGEALTNPSFKVIYASILFSLTQRPSNAGDELMPSKKDLDSLHIILERDTSPTYLDLAVFKLRQHQRGKTGPRRGPAASIHTLPLSADDQRTYAVVLWMAVMFDSMSAAINGTSFVLSDADTNKAYEDFNREHSISIPSEPMSDILDEITDETPLQSELDLWGKHLLSRHTRHGTVRIQRAHWPCSFEDAASCLADGIPVLILFYRRIGQLQKLHYRRASLQKLAAGLSAALDVYHHWNDTHGLFIEECVSHHRDLFSRIQSWYVLLSSNFNMGVLILSDLIEKLDAEHMMVPRNSTTMHQPDCAKTMRFRAAYAISDLARCCCGENINLDFSESLGVNNAICQSALLRECWPTVLTRSLTYASEVFVRMILVQKDLGPLLDTAALCESQARLDDCINALWLLGRKSDQAACVNTVLRQIVHPELTVGDTDPSVNQALKGSPFAHGSFGVAS